MSHPPNISPAIQASICRALKKGHYLAQAANLAGVPTRTLMRWLAKGRDADEANEDNPYRAFNDAVQEAIAHAENECLNAVDEAIEHGTWQAAAWKAERRWPERWGRRDPTAITLAALKNLPTDQASMLEELKGIVARLQHNYEVSNGNPPALEAHDDDTDPNGAEVPK